MKLKPAKTSCTFLDLPAEMRIVIYDLMLSDLFPHKVESTRWDVPSSGEALSSLMRLRSGVHSIQNMQEVSLQVYDEMISQFFLSPRYQPHRQLQMIYGAIGNIRHINQVQTLTSFIPDQWHSNVTIHFTAYRTDEYCPLENLLGRPLALHVIHDVLVPEKGRNKTQVALKSKLPWNNVRLSSFKNNPKDTILAKMVTVLKPFKLDIYVLWRAIYRRNPDDGFLLACVQMRSSLEDYRGLVSSEDITKWSLSDVNDGPEDVRL
jgi:hypothetical protein